MINSRYSDDIVQCVLETLEPHVQQAQHRLQNAVADLQSNLGEPFRWEAVVESGCGALAARLFGLFVMPIIGEQHVARVRGQRACDGIRLLEKYPVLRQQANVACDQWVTNSREFITRLCSDWPSIQQTFSLACGLESLERVTETGDRHMGGRAVLLLRFTTGEKLLYKPRSFAPEAHFQELLRWLNTHTATAHFRPLKILNRDNYGWMEFVTPEACSSVEQVERFYDRCGRQLALLYVLLATDMHHENIIAAGEQPMLIDLETVFHPCVGPVTEPQVSRTGLLPRRLTEKRIDCSGLTGRGRTVATTISRDPADGRCRLTRRRRPASADHRPKLGDQTVCAEDYRDRICHGFGSMYGVLRQNRDALTRSSGPLARFDEDAVRVVLRSTRAYTTLRRAAYHPNLMRDDARWNAWFGCLRRGSEAWLDAGRVIAAERRGLQQGDIPRFTSRPASRDLYLGDADKVANFFTEPTALQVQRQLGKLDDRDLNKCLHTIRSSLASG